AIDNVSTGGARTANTLAQSATPGQTIVLAGTGLGNAAAPEVWIAGKAAAVISVRRQTEGARPDELWVRVPAGGAEGCFAPVQVRRAGRLPSNTVTLAIHKTGGACQPLDAIPFAAWQGSRFALVAAARTIAHDLDAPGDATTDEAGGAFAKLPEVDRMQ